MTSVLRVKHLEHERLVMEFLKKIAATASRWTLILAQFFLDNEQHFLDSHLWICALGIEIRASNTIR
jgi:hypothetical protein